MKIKILLYLIVLALLWGPAFLFIKVAVQDIPPLTLVMVRLGVAAAILYGVLRFQGRRLPRLGLIWKHCAVVGLLYNTLPFVLVSWGQQYIDSAPAAILIGTTPLFTMILAHLFTANDHLTPAKTIGVGLGFAGLVALLGPALLSGVQATLWGLLTTVLAAASYAGAFVYAQKTLRGLPPLVGPTAQLISSALFLLPLAVIVEHPYDLPLPSWPALGSLILLTILSTVLAFVIYYQAMEITSATVLSMTTYMIPIVAIILGVVVLSEQLNWNAYLGCGLIIVGVMVVNGVFQLTGWRQLTSAMLRP